MEICCFVLGILLVFTTNFYLLLAVAWIYFISPKYPIFLFFILGLLMASLHQWIILPRGMPNVDVIPKAIVSGIIESIPVQTPYKTTFNFRVETLNQQKVNGLLQLNWYNQPPKIHAGQAWQFQVKLRKPRNFMNPGSYNYLGALKSKHVFWTGYVLSKEGIQLDPLQSQPSSTRERLAMNLKRQTPQLKTAGILKALTLNLNEDISQADWELFRRTGTIHLFGISGEHVALVSGFIFFIVKWLWSRSPPLCLFLPANYPASFGGLSAAFVYSLLAGFAPPVQRALIGCFFYTLCALGRKKFSAWQIWRYALFSVLCFEPHAVYMQGFYFSFIAVACLLLTHQRWQLKGYKQTLALQTACLIGLMPLSLYWYAYGSINGFIANMFAIPLIGFLIVPLALITLILSPWFSCTLLIKGLTGLIALLFQGLILTESLSGMNIRYALPNLEFVFCLMGLLLIWIALPIKSFYGIVFLWALLPWLPSRTIIHPGEALVQVLDVGQGLAVSIRTAKHVLLYDTGDKFFHGGDLGKLVVLPFYKALNVRKIDTIVISHPDKDHGGGLKSILDGMKVDSLIINSPGAEGSNCHEYPSWVWDGVNFSFLPILGPFKDKNNRSCILQISTLGGKILLTGDIEDQAEDYLVKKYGSKLTSEVLLIPHHGSKTSSTYRFLMEVAPKYAIASLGFDNKFHFPHDKTLKKLKYLGIDFYRTDTCGMTEVFLPAQGKVGKPCCYGDR